MGIFGESGNLRCWGSADYGQLGFGNNSDIGDDELPTDAEVVSWR